jgi:hypothetical protein
MVRRANRNVLATTREAKAAACDTYDLRRQELISPGLTWSGQEAGNNNRRKCDSCGQGQPALARVRF